MKSKLRLNESGLHFIYSTPPFANTMLGDTLERHETKKEKQKKNHKS